MEDRNRLHEIPETLWLNPENVRDSTTQTVALVTHQGPGHRSPAPPAAHLLQLEVASQSLKPVDAVAIYALWRREGNWGYAPCRNSPLREVVGLARLIRLLVSGLPCLRFGSK